MSKPRAVRYAADNGRSYVLFSLHLCPGGNVNCVTLQGAGRHQGLGISLSPWNPWSLESDWSNVQIVQIVQIQHVQPRSTWFGLEEVRFWTEHFKKVLMLVKARDPVFEGFQVWSLRQRCKGNPRAHGGWESALSWVNRNTPTSVNRISPVLCFGKSERFHISSYL